MRKTLVDNLISVSLLPTENRTVWLRSAESAVAYVEKIVGSPELILHTNVGFTLITTVLAPLGQVKRLKGFNAPFESAWQCEPAFGRVATALNLSGE
jgi:hypothetical protein